MSPQDRKPEKLATAGDRLIAGLVGLVHRRAGLVVALAAVLCVLAYGEARTIRVNTGLEALMPEGVPSVENLDRVIEKTGSFASAAVVITSPDPDAAVAFAESLQKKVLTELDWAGAAEFSEDFTIFERNKLLYLKDQDLEALRAWAEGRALAQGTEALAALAGAPVNVRIRSQPAFPAVQPKTPEQLMREYGQAGPDAGQSQERRLFRDADGKILILVVWPEKGGTSMTLSRRIVEDLNRLITEVNPASFNPEMTAEVGGRIYNRVVQYNTIMDDLESGAYWTVGLILLTLLLYFRSFAAIVVLFLPLSAGILWTLAFAAIFIGQLNLITVFLGLILFGLGIDFGIHNLARYEEARAGGATLEGALRIIFRQTGTASLLAGVTTAVGFLSLLSTDFRAFSEFGQIAGTGIIMTFVAMYTAMPALLTILDRFGIDFSRRTAAARGLPILLPPRRLVLGIFSLMILAALWFAPKARFEDNFGRLEAPRSAEHQALEDKIAKVFPDGTDRAVLIVDSLDDVAAVERYFADYIAADTETPTISKVESVYDFVPPADVQRRRLALIKNIRTELTGDNSVPRSLGEDVNQWRDQLEPSEVTVDDLPEGLHRLFTGEPGTKGYLVYIFNSVSMNDWQQARNFADDIRNVPVNGKIYHPAAEGLVFVDMLELMRADLVYAVAIVTAVIFLVLLAFLRSFRDTLLVLLPTYVGLLLMFGVMGAFDIRLSIFNMVVIPTLIGIGVDNGIHIFRRFREEGGDLRLALRETGGAAGIATLTTLFGFGSMAGAQMPGLDSLGLLAICGFLLCLAASWFLLPAVLRTLKSK